MRLNKLFLVLMATISLVACDPGIGDEVLMVKIGTYDKTTGLVASINKDVLKTTFPDGSKITHTNIVLSPSGIYLIRKIIAKGHSKLEATKLRIKSNGDLVLEATEKSMFGPRTLLESYICSTEICDNCMPKNTDPKNGCYCFAHKVEDVDCNFEIRIIPPEEILDL